MRIGGPREGFVDQNPRSVQLRKPLSKLDHSFLSNVNFRGSYIWTTRILEDFI